MQDETKKLNNIFPLAEGRQWLITTLPGIDGFFVQQTWKASDGSSRFENVVWFKKRREVRAFIFALQLRDNALRVEEDGRLRYITCGIR